jgi:hypothetical protein
MGSHAPLLFSSRENFKMMLWIFITFFCLILALLFLSYFYDNISEAPINFIKLFGWAFMFLFAVACITSGIEYKSGATILDEGVNTTVTDVYTTYYNTTGFILLAIMSALAFGMVLYHTGGI